MPQFILETTGVKNIFNFVEMLF